MQTVGHPFASKPAWVSEAKASCWKGSREAVHSNQTSIDLERTDCSACQGIGLLSDGGQTTACRGFTLIELMIVLVLIGLLISITLPSTSPAVHEQLRAVGQIIRTDLAYARSLAIAHGSTYRVRFELLQNRYILQHTGPDPTLNLLPNSPWRHPADPPDQHVVRLDQLPQVASSVRLAAVQPPSSANQTIGEVEFGPLGGTTHSTAVVIWLSAGQDQNQRFLSISVDPITGLTSFGPMVVRVP
ncbi:MAG: type II secretion system GspH family protein [Thermoguttaceae bacterium]|nr:type II secretion system GspH family protein [Thermoguttaceae bacterium]MDW8038335.1 type II secretion system protein [Thermoguttaceae bacterium]